MDSKMNYFHKTNVRPLQVGGEALCVRVKCKQCVIVWSDKMEKTFFGKPESLVCVIILEYTWIL